MANNSLLPAILDEGYCCVHGYIRLCKARGETRKGMAEFIGVPIRTVASNIYEYGCGNRPCQEHSDCMLPEIAKIEKGV